MGDGALETIHQQDQAIGILSAGFAACQREIATLALDHAEFKRSCSVVNGATFNSLMEFCGRSFLSRLRWLVTGR